MPKGRKPKSADQRRIEGYKTDAAAGNSAGQNASVDPPAWLDSIGRKEWRRLLRAQPGQFSVLDEGVLACYCECWSTIVDAKEHLRAESRVVVHSNKVTGVNHWVKVMEAAMKQLATLADRLGLTPQSRRSLPTPQQKEEIDDLKVFMDGAGAS